MAALSATAGVGQVSENVDPTQAAWAAAQAPWASKAKPDDVVKDHVELIAGGRHAYTIVQGGTIDGCNSRTPLSCGMMREGACEQTWESNRAVRMENVGDTNVINPWLSNGQNDFRTLQEIVNAAVKAGMTDAEKAFALFYQEVCHRFHFGGDNNELGNPVRVFNVYGYNTCGNDSICLAGLWRAAGMQAAPARAIGHCISQVFYDNTWHMFDGDMHVVYLERDNQTVAGDQDITRDHDLVKRTHNYGILWPDQRSADEGEASLFVYVGAVAGRRDCTQGTTMDMVLRPGESLTWRWGHLSPPKIHGPETPIYPDTICNGLWEYQPDFTKDIWRQSAESVEAVRITPEGLAAEPGKTGTIVWLMRSPYPFVGGHFEAQGTGAKFELSKDNKSWTDVSSGILDYQFPAEWGPWYEYRLRCRLDGDARLKGLHIVGDLQMAPLVLPEMGVGNNDFLYTDQSPNGRRVRITHVWVERSSSRPPLASPAAINPTAGGKADGTNVVFRWQPPTDPDGHAITDYQFELSRYADMRWPLSMDFRKIISRTADRGEARYTLPSPGLLTPDTVYYWRVCAKNSEGVWGPWSATWSFTPHGPDYPLDVQAVQDPTTGAVTLNWKANTVGSAPASYRVYGSDEKGFSISDKPYAVNVGISKELKSPFPANFIAETKETSLAVLGRSVFLPHANKTYYRVVAVDAQGRRSGPSDYAEAPRPVVYSTPPLTAKVGAPYRYEVRVNASLGDLKDRVVNGAETRNFWNIEQRTFTLEQGPQWLKVDPKTGALSGTPTAAGRADVVVTATLSREKRVLHEPSLIWGVEKVVSTGIETVGKATQKFTIDVQP
jgi:hypothetical protein